jgi:hypothetical protein
VYPLQIHDIEPSSSSWGMRVDLEEQET